jgi:AraC-like DNA-binding protein
MNVLERYGIRTGDKPSLHPLIAVIGKRVVESLIPKALSPHSMPLFQMIFVDQGELDWWVDGRYYHLSQGDLILVKPHEVQNSFKGALPVGSRFFLQIDLYELKPKIGLSSEECELIQQLLTQFIPRVISPGNHFKTPFLQLLHEHRNNHQFSTLNAKAYLFQIINCLYQTQLQYLKSANVIQSEALQMIDEVDKYIAAKLDEIIKTADLAKLFDLSEAHFRRKFLASAGTSPIKYCAHKKLQEARRLLEENHLSISEIALKLNFSSSQHFSSNFSKSFSIGPAEYRKELLKAFRKSPLKKTSQVASEMASRFTKVDE